MLNDLDKILFLIVGFIIGLLAIATLIGIGAEIYLK